MSELILERPVADLRRIAVVGGAHFTSHFFQLVLPPLFPAMHAGLGLSYSELGLVMTAFFTASALAQVVAGFVVDHVGPHVVLPAGMALLAAAILGIGLMPAYPAMLLLAALAGLGNSVYHPADYSVLTGCISPRRLARAYSVHTICGTLGWAAAPVTALFLSQCFGWQRALEIVGLFGLVAAALVAADRADLTLPPQTAKAKSQQGGPGLMAILSVPIVVAFAYFTLLAVAVGGTQSFLPIMLPRVQDVSVAQATEMLTFYLVANALGSYAGGHVADMTPNHDRIIAIGLAGAAALMLTLAFVPMPTYLLFAAAIAAGFLVGMTTPSRDMLVRAATPAGATGKVFGFVYSGLDLGSLIVPVVMGALLDHGFDHVPFVFIAGALATTILLAFAVRRSGR